MSMQANIEKFVDLLQVKEYANNDERKQSLVQALLQKTPCDESVLFLCSNLVEPSLSSSTSAKSVKKSVAHWAAEHAPPELFAHFVRWHLHDRVTSLRDSNDSTPLHVFVLHQRGDQAASAVRLMFCSDTNNSGNLKLSKKWPVLETRDSNRCTPLLLAALVDNVDVYEALIEAGADEEARRERRQPSASALMLRGLLAKRTRQGEQPQQLDNTVAATSLVFSSTPLVSTTTPTQCAPFVTEACCEGDVDVVQTYLEAGGDPNARSRGDTTLLHLAYANNHAALVELLIDFGAVDESIHGDATTTAETVFVTGETRTAYQNRFRRSPFVCAVMDDDYRVAYHHFHGYMASPTMPTQDLSLVFSALSFVKNNTEKAEDEDPYIKDRNLIDSAIEAFRTQRGNNNGDDVPVITILTIAVWHGNAALIELLVQHPSACLDVVTATLFFVCPYAARDSALVTQHSAAHRILRALLSIDVHRRLYAALLCDEATTKTPRSIAHTLVGDWRYRPATDGEVEERLRVQADLDSLMRVLRCRLEKDTRSVRPCDLAHFQHILSTATSTTSGSTIVTPRSNETLTTAASEFLGRAADNFMAAMQLDSPDHSATTPTSEADIALLSALVDARSRYRVFPEHPSFSSFTTDAKSDDEAVSDAAASRIKLMRRREPPDQSPLHARGWTLLKKIHPPYLSVILAQRTNQRNVDTLFRVASALVVESLREGLPHLFLFLLYNAHHWSSSSSSKTPVQKFLGSDKVSSVDNTLLIALCVRDDRNACLLHEWFLPREPFLVQDRFTFFQTDGVENDTTTSRKTKTTLLEYALACGSRRCVSEIERFRRINGTSATSRT
jgi:ankyrin repeat protein